MFKDSDFLLKFSSPEPPTLTDYFQLLTYVSSESISI